MTFSTEKRKIFKIWNDSNGNQFQISDLSSNDQIILSKIDKLNDTDMVYNNVINLSSEWLIPDTRSFTSEGDPEELFKEFEVIINGINKNLIPYIEAKVAYRLGDSEISLPIPDTSGNPGIPFDEVAEILINSIVEITEVIDDSTRNIVYRSSIFIENGNGLPSELQLRFFVNIVNPNYYQST